MKFLLIALFALYSMTVSSTYTCSKVVMVGTGNAQSVPGRVGPSTVVCLGDESNDCCGKYLMFDLGNGAIRRWIDEADFLMENVLGVFPSHVHADHMIEMAHAAYYAYFTGQGPRNPDATGKLYKPLPIYVPNGQMLEFIQMSLEGLKFDMSHRNRNFNASWAIFNYTASSTPQTIYSQDGVTVKAVYVAHFDEVAVSWRIDIENVGSVVISGDISDAGTAAIESLSNVQLPEQRVDVLVHEILMPQFFPVGRVHTMPAVVAERATNMTKLLVLTHMIPSPCIAKLGKVPRPVPYLLEDDFSYAVSSAGYEGEIVVAADMTSVKLPGREVTKTYVEARHCEPVPDDYVPLRPCSHGGVTERDRWCYEHGYNNGNGNGNQGQGNGNGGNGGK